MADPLRHKCKLDIAEDILNFIENNSDAGEVRVIIEDALGLTDIDLEDAYEVVNNLRELIRDQQY